MSKNRFPMSKLSTSAYMFTVIPASECPTNNYTVGRNL